MEMETLTLWVICIERKVLAFSVRKTTIFALTASVKENQLQVSARKSGGQKPLLDPTRKSGGSTDPLDQCFRGLPGGPKK